MKNKLNDSDDDDKPKKKLCKSIHNQNIDENVLNKIRGGLFGKAIGDALGFPFEFTMKLSEYNGLLEYKPKIRTRVGYKIGAIGQYSDDTQMTIALATNIIKHNGDFCKHSLVTDYMKFANSCKFIGKNTRKLLLGIKTINGYEKRVEKYMDIKNESNGSLMRCCPIAATNIDVKKDCEITNISPTNIECGRIYITILKKYLNNEIPDIHKIYAELNIKEKSVLDVLKDIDSKKKRDVTQKSNKGWVCNALWCALSVMDRDSYCDSIDQVIRYGGDTDTNAAIAGSLIGYKIGFEKMMEETRTKTNFDVMINADLNSPQNNYKCSEDYHPKLISYLAEKLTQIYVSNKTN
jgi:ADP-ribosyl-[dinitrogen reductase] hydrolase